METTQLMSIREAAKELKVSRQQVDRLARRGILPSAIVSGRKMVFRSAVESRRRILGVRK